MPYSDWIVGEEKRRRRRSWMMGIATGLTVVAIGAAIMVPIFTRRVVIADLAKKFSDVEQVLITEEHVGPNNVRFDKRVVEESKQERRLEYEEGNIMFFIGERGGSKLDKRRRTHMEYQAMAMTPSSYLLVRDLLNVAAKDVKTSVQKTQMSGGRLSIRDDNRTYVITPGEGYHLATVDVQIDNDLGKSTILTWKFERVKPDSSRFDYRQFTRIRPRTPVSTILNVEPQLEMRTSLGPSQVVRMDINEKGDVFIADRSRYRLEYDIAVKDSSTYAWIPSDVGRLIVETGENIRQNLAYRKRGTNLSFPFTVEISARPADHTTEKPFKFTHTFEGPTCTLVPEYEHGVTAADQPIISHKLRSYLCEASLAETGFGLVRYANAEAPVKDAMNALTYYRFAISYSGQASTQTYGATPARIYYSIYRCYVAARQEKAGQSALLVAKARNSGRDPWLDQKIDEAMIREGLVEVE